MSLSGDCSFSQMSSRSAGLHLASRTLDAFGSFLYHFGFLDIVDIHDGGISVLKRHAGTSPLDGVVQEMNVNAKGLK